MQAWGMGLMVLQELSIHFRPTAIGRSGSRFRAPWIGRARLLPSLLFCLTPKRLGRSLALPLGTWSVI